MSKFISIITVLVLLTTFLYACTSEKTNEETQKATTSNETVSETETDIKINKPTETNRETTSLEKETATETESEIIIHTELRSDPLKASLFPKASKETVFINGIADSIPKEQIYSVTDLLNKTIQHGKWDVLKLAVTDEMVKEIIKTETCIELKFDKNHVFDKKSVTGYGYNFEYDKVLLVFTGEYKDCIFFSLSQKYYDGEIQNEYLNGPLKEMNGKLSKSFLGAIDD